MPVRFSIQNSGALLPANGQPVQRSIVPVAPSTSPLAASASPGQREVGVSPQVVSGSGDRAESFISLEDVVCYFKKFGLLALLLAIPSAVLLFYLIGMGTPVYESEAKLRLRLGENNVLKLPDMRQGGAGEMSAPLLVNNHLTGLKSRSYAEYFYERVDPKLREEWMQEIISHPGRKTEILRKLGLTDEMSIQPDKEFFVDQVLATVRVEPQKESHILRIMVRDTSPRVSAEVVNQFAKNYIRFHGEQESGLTEDERQYLVKKASELRLRLEDSERKLAEYRQNQSIIGSGESGSVESARMQQFNTASADAQQRLIRAKTDLQVIRQSQQAGRDPLEVRVIADNKEVSSYRQQLDLKLTQRRSLEATCGRRHPLMIAISGEIDSLKTSLDRAVGAVITMAENEVASLERQVQDYESQLNSARGLAAGQSSKSVQYNLLLDQVSADRTMYQTLMGSLNKAEVTGEYKESGALTLADTAGVPNKPVKPNKALAAAASIIVFSLLMVGFPLGWGMVDQHLLDLLRRGKSEAHAHQEMPLPRSQETQPLLAEARGEAPEVPRLTTPPPEMLRLHTASTDALSIPTLGSAPILAHLPKLQSTAPESVLSTLLKAEPEGAAGALHQITSQLELNALRRSGLGGIILITSPDSGEGKTCSAAALAATFCRQGRSVFMMECHTVAPALHRWFPRSSPSSSSARDLETLRYGDTRLFLLPGHDLPAFATNEMLDGYRSWIEQARDHVDWIILDAGPVLKNFADVAPLAPLATDVLLVTEPARTSLAKLRAALALLDPMMSRTAFRGLILNGERSPTGIKKA